VPNSDNPQPATHVPVNANGDEGTGSAARGVVRAWLAAKAARWLVRIAAWAGWIAAFAAYAGYVAWRVKRLVRSGALDDDPDPSSPMASEVGVLAWVRGSDARSHR
jgi:hypothetical protein